MKWSSKCLYYFSVCIPAVVAASPAEKGWRWNIPFGERGGEPESAREDSPYRLSTHVHPSPPLGSAPPEVGAGWILLAFSFSGFAHFPENEIHASPLCGSVIDIFLTFFLFSSWNPNVPISKHACCNDEGLNSQLFIALSHLNKKKKLEARLWARAHIGMETISAFEGQWTSKDTRARFCFDLWW